MSSPRLPPTSDDTNASPGVNESDRTGRPIQFPNAETRLGEMRAAIQDVVSQVATGLPDSRTGVSRDCARVMQRWLIAVGRFGNEQTWDNCLLIALQAPDATHLQSFDAWSNQGYRVNHEATAVWLRSLLDKQRCPDCGCGSDADHGDCFGTLATPDLVHPATEASWLLMHPRFDSSQVSPVETPTDTDTTPTDDMAWSPPSAGCLLKRLLDLQSHYGVSVQFRSPDEWEYGTTVAVCIRRDPYDLCPVIDIRETASEADIAKAIINNYVRASLDTPLAQSENPSPSLESKLATIAVNTCLWEEADVPDIRDLALALDTWTGDDPVTIRDRFDRIATSAGELLARLRQHTGQQSEV